MNFGCSLSNATVDPTEKSTTRPATASAAGSQKRKARRTSGQRQHEQPGEQPHGEHGDALLEAGAHEQQVHRGAHEREPGHGAGERDDAAAGRPGRRRPHGRSTRAAPMSPSEPPTSDHVSR